MFVAEKNGFVFDSNKMRASIRIHAGEYPETESNEIVETPTVASEKTQFPTLHCASIKTSPSERLEKVFTNVSRRKMPK